MESIAIIGAGGHAASVAETAASAGYNVRCFVDDHSRTDNLLGFPIVRSDARHQVLDGAVFALAIGDNSVREQVAARWLAAFPHAIFPPLVHASASVSRYATIGEGSVVLQGAIVGSAASVGRFCIMNTGASVDHDCTIHDFASLAPRVAAGGHVRVGTRSAIGIGAVVKHGVTIGDDAIVGANSYVNHDVGDLVVAYGTPSRAVRSRKRTDPYLK